MEEYLLAKNIDFWMALLGIDDPIDSLYSDFQRKHPSSSYLTSLESRYRRFVKVAPGQPAPQIKGVTINGDTVALSDIRGKVVFVDVWASWCGPCIQEIPFSQKLQAKFQNSDSVVFLNVSVDHDTTAWRKALFTHKNWKGIHINVDRSIYKSYNIRGIPRYILINKKGKNS